MFVLRRYHLYLLLLALFFSKHLSIYLPIFELSLSFSTIGFLALGFFSNNLTFSLFSAGAIDLSSFYLKQIGVFNPFIFLQVLVLTLIGWIVRFIFFNLKTKDLKIILFVVNLLGFISFSFVGYLSLLVPLLSFLLWIFNRKTERLSVIIILSLSLCSYLVSFGLGLPASWYALGSEFSCLISYKIRVLKEILKIFIFFNMLFLYSVNKNEAQII